MNEIQKVGFEDLKTLQELSRITFYESFADSNTREADLLMWKSLCGEEGLL